MHAVVLITCSGVDGKTDSELDLTALKQIQPLTGTKQYEVFSKVLSFLGTDAASNVCTIVRGIVRDY